MQEIPLIAEHHLAFGIVTVIAAFGVRKGFDRFDSGIQ
jgi:hypothetical protein